RGEVFETPQEMLTSGVLTSNQPNLALLPLFSRRREGKRIRDLIQDKHPTDEGYRKSSKDLFGESEVGRAPPIRTGLRRWEPGCNSTLTEHLYISPTQPLECTAGAKIARRQGAQPLLLWLRRP